MERSNKKWYEKTWFMLILLVILPPIGIIFLWQSKKKISKSIKIILTLISTILFITYVVSACKEPTPESELASTTEPVISDKALYYKYYNDFVQSQYEQGLLYQEVNIKTAIVDSSGSLGSDLSYCYQLNGQDVTSGDSVLTLPEYTCYAKIIESDSIHDVGEGSAILCIPDVLTDGSSTWFNVTVTETGERRNAGAYTTWEVAFSLTPIVEFDDVVDFGMEKLDSKDNK